MADPISRPARPKPFGDYGIGHVGLKVSDIEKSRKFYDEILGLQSESKNLRTALIRCGPDSLVIYEKDAGALDSHFGFRLGSRALVEEWKNWITRNGIKTFDDIAEKGHPRSFKFRDPDGYLIEISSKT